MLHFTDSLAVTLVTFAFGVAFKAPHWAIAITCWLTFLLAIRTGD